MNTFAIYIKNSSACPAVLRDACSAVPRSDGPQTAPIGLPACDARPLDVRVRDGSRQGQAGRPGHATARWRGGAGCGGGGAEARGAAAGWADSDACGCRVWIGGGSACAGGVQGRGGGARQGAEWGGCGLRLRVGGGLECQGVVSKGGGKVQNVRVQGSGVG